MDDEYCLAYNGESRVCQHCKGIDLCDPDEEMNISCYRAPSRGVIA